MKKAELSAALVCVAYALSDQDRTLFNQMGNDQRKSEGQDMVFAYHVLADWTGASYEECMVAIETACNAGLIDYGRRQGEWLTKAGKDVLANACLDPIAMWAQSDRRQTLCSILGVAP